MPPHADAAARRRRPHALAIDFAGVGVAAVLAWRAALGPVGVEPFAAVEGAVLAVDASEPSFWGRANGELRFRLDGHAGTFAHPLALANGPMLRLALERGERAYVETDRRGRLVRASVDGVAVVTAEDTARRARDGWSSEILGLFVLLAIFVLVRPLPDRLGSPAERSG